MDKRKTLEEIFKDDPLDLLAIKAKQINTQTPDERLASSFQEIKDFVEKHGKEPTANITNIAEYQLYARLKSIKSDNQKVEMLKDLDTYNLLPKQEFNLASEAEVAYSNNTKEIKSVDDLLQADSLGLLGDDDELGLFEFKHTPKENVRESADFVARRKPCKDFAKYENLFEEVQGQLASGKRKLIPFKQGILREGEFYVHNGVLFLLEKINIDKKEHYKADGTRVREDGRTRCVFENGTESNMLKRSVEKILYANGYGLTKASDSVSEELIEDFSAISKDDKEAGYIYVLKSKSEDPRVAFIRNLYKIGYTQNVDERLRGADKQPTYLMAPVEYIAGWKCYNMNARKFENLIHKFFGHTCLEVDIYDEKGVCHTPREWFIAPIEIIEQAIELIINGKVIHYQYDTENQTIVRRHFIG